MKKMMLAMLTASSLLISSTASAAWMYIDVGSNTYDENRGFSDGFPAVPARDADTTTGLFNEFGFNQIWTSSIYDFNDNSLLGDFFDTNITQELVDAGIPLTGISGNSLAGTPLSLIHPDCANGQCDIDALSPLAPPLNSDREGFLGSWDLQVLYKFNGQFTAGGPVFTDGFFEIYFNDFMNNANSRLVLKAELTGFNIEDTNLDLFFDITFAETGFLWINNGSSFVDAAAGIPTGDFARFQIDTNVNPPIPTPDQLLVVTAPDGSRNAIRQSTLDGSATASIPEPGSLAIIGLGLVGLGALRRRQLGRQQAK